MASGEIANDERVALFKDLLSREIYTLLERM